MEGFDVSMYHIERVFCLPRPLYFDYDMLMCWYLVPCTLYFVY